MEDVAREVDFKGNIIRTFEITLNIPIDDIEAPYILQAAEALEVDATITKSGRILSIEGPDNIEGCIQILATIGFAEDIGLIREITDFYPIWDEDEDTGPQINFDFE